MFGFFIFTNVLFLGIILLLKPSKVKSANVFLALFLFSLGLELLPNFFDKDFFLPETIFLTVPLLFLYVRRLIRRRVKPVYYLLLLPAVLSNVLNTLVPLSNEPDFLIETLVQVPFYGVNLWLLFSMNSLITKHQQTLKDQFANLDRRTLEWIKRLVWVFLVFSLVWVLEDVLRFMSINSRAPTIISEILTFLSVFWVGYFGLSQRESYVQAIDDLKSLKNPSETDANDLNEFNRVRSQIEHSKLYLNQDLTLGLLAQQVSVDDRKLSAWINSFTKGSFYLMVNTYRIEEFKSQLTNPKNKRESLLGIGQDSGFKNKSSFYNTFKELEGITPKEYKNTVLIKPKV